MAKKKKLLSTRPGRYFPSEPILALDCPRMNCCLHETCAPLKKRGLCNQWYFLRCVSPKPLLPSNVLQELRRSFGEDKFNCYGVKRDPCVYEILVRADLDGPLLFGKLLFGASLTGDAGDAALAGRESGSSAWHLQCCWDAFKWDAKDWIMMLRDAQGKFTMGDVDLVDDFEDVVREALRAQDGVA